MYDIVSHDSLLFDAKPRPAPLPTAPPPVPPPPQAPFAALPTDPVGPAAQLLAAMCVADDLAPLLGSVVDLAEEIGRRLVISQRIHGQIHDPLVAAGREVPSIEAVGQWTRRFIDSLGDRLGELTTLFSPLAKS